MAAENLDDDHPCVGSVQLNGKPLRCSFLRHSEILAGGELRFVMQREPNKDWAVSPGDRPYSLSPC